MSGTRSMRSCSSVWRAGRPRLATTGVFSSSQPTPRLCLRIHGPNPRYWTPSVRPRSQRLTLRSIPQDSRLYASNGRVADPLAPARVPGFGPEPRMVISLWILESVTPSWPPSISQPPHVELARHGQQEMASATGQAPATVTVTQDQVSPRQ